MFSSVATYFNLAAPVNEVADLKTKELMKDFVKEKVPIFPSSQTNKRLNKFKNIRNSYTVNAIDKRNSVSRNTELVLIKGLSDGIHPLTILIDSASQAEVISQGAVDRLGKVVKPIDTCLISAQGNELEVTGQTTFDLSIGESIYSFEAIVTPTLTGPYDIILGIAFLNKYRTVLATTPGYSPKFTIDDKTIPLLTLKW